MLINILGIKKREITEQHFSNFGVFFILKPVSLTIYKKQELEEISPKKRPRKSGHPISVCLPVCACTYACMLQVCTCVFLDYSPLYTLSVMVRTAIRTMLSGWLKNLMASVYRAKSLVCCMWERKRERR